MEELSLDELLARVGPRRPTRELSVILQLALAIGIAVTAYVSLPLILVVALVSAWRQARARRRVIGEVMLEAGLASTDVLPVGLHGVAEPISGVPDFCGALVEPGPFLLVRAYCAAGGREAAPRGPTLRVPLPLEALEVSPEGSVAGLLFTRARYVAAPGGALAALVQEGRRIVPGPSRRNRDRLARVLAPAARPPRVVGARPGPLGRYGCADGCEPLLAIVALIGCGLGGLGVSAWLGLVSVLPIFGGAIAAGLVLAFGRWRRDRYGRVALQDRWLVHEQDGTFIHRWETFSGYDDGATEYVLLRTKRRPAARVTIPTPDEATRTAVLAWLDRKGLPRVEVGA